MRNSAIADHSLGHSDIASSSSQLCKPCWDGISPVISVARVGEHMPFTEKARSNRITLAGEPVDIRGTDIRVYHRSP